jgi:Protein of unknown function (DUF3047)
MKTFTSARLWLWASALLLLAGCATVNTPEADSANPKVGALIVQAPSLSEYSLLDVDALDVSIARLWMNEKFPFKTKTAYQRVSIGGRNAIKAVSSRSASAYARKANISLAANTKIRWSWQVEGLIKGANNSDKNTEDSPARLVLTFDGDKASLPLKDQMFLERASLVLGRPAPYSTLMYIVANESPVDTVINNPHSNRIKKIVVASGDGAIMKWQSFERDVAQDYTKAYGYAPGKLIGVALFTDTDNTGEQATAYYGSITIKTP